LKTNDFHTIVISGHGRSGTNWLLEILDYSSRTHCRNEPDRLSGALLNELPNRIIGAQRSDNFSDAWDEAVREAQGWWGERDHPPPRRKDHMNEFARRSGLYSLFFKSRFRRVWNVLLTGYQGAHWRIPYWVCPPEKLKKALPVLKINQSPGWIEWVLAERPNTAVLHIVRHPGGMLNSWKNRYVAGRDQGSILEASRARLKEIAERDATWAQRFGDIDALNLLELELWFWRFETETVHEAGGQCDNYHLVRYEALASRSVNTAKELYCFCGLQWNSEIEALVAANSGGAAVIADKWRTQLSNQEVASIQRIMVGSPLRDWWDVG
jgi:hypothetical protein